MKSSPRATLSVVLFAAALGATCLVFTGCRKGEAPAPGGAAKGRPPVPVLVAKAEQANVPVELRALGAVEPVQSSPVRSMITGTVTAVDFREGDLVVKGQVLFRLDRRPLEAALRQLQANLARDEAQARSAEAQTQSTEAQVRNAEAQLRNAEAQAKRYEELVAKDLVAREQYDQRVTNLDAAKAALDATRAAALSGRAALDVSRAAGEATKAAIENARLQLDYTVIAAPVSGQTGSLGVDTGDLVKANDATLVVVNQIQPILVRFSIPERRLAEVQAYRRQGTLSVRAQPAGAGAQPLAGRIVFLDNTVDTTTGTIALKAQFDNADQALWPGQFVDVFLVLTVRENAVVVPAEAVQSGQQGSYVYVVDGGTATVRPVTAGQSTSGKTIVEKGLAAGETVVTDGQLRLTPGAAVVLKSELGGPSGAPGKPAAGGTPAGAPAAEKPR